MDESIWSLPHIFASQEDAVDDILNDRVKAGDVVIVREGPGGLGMQGCSIHQLHQVERPRFQVLLTDGRFSGGTSGLSIGHASPEAAAALLVWEQGDIIRIDIRAQ